MNTITAFSLAKQPFGGDRPILAVDEDGLILAEHISSNDSFGRRDIGVSDHPVRSTAHDDIYSRRYPDGWVVEWTDDEGRIKALGERAVATAASHPERVQGVRPDDTPV